MVDIETCPNIGYFWSPGPKVRINHDAIIRERRVICIAWKWEGEAKSHVLTWDRRQNDKAMLRAFLKIAVQADEVVAHNGGRFDIPWLRTRCLVHGLPTFPDVKIVDTLKIAWSKFHFNNAKLDYLAKFLGLGAKTTTGFSLWKRVMDGDLKALKQMADYCLNDVAMLELVYHKLIPAIKPPTHAGVFAGQAAWSCPRCGSTNVIKSKTRVTASGALQHQMRCKDCGEYYTISNAVYRKYQKATGR